VLAFDGLGADHHRPGDPLASLAGDVRDDRVRVEPRLQCEHPGCPLRSAIVAPLVVQDRRVGALVALYERPGRLRLEETRVVGEAAALVSAMVQLSEMEAQGERLARAELRALRAQISPHFIYNALAAVASFIHSRPEEARELLTEFAEFIRYAFARQRAYVTVADELRYVEKYLRLEQARFGERLKVRVQVDPEVLQAVLPVLSLQPLVENAVRHGVESQPEGGLVSIEGIDLGNDVALRVSDDGDGIDPERVREALEGGGPGIGLGNVHGRLLSTFGEGYGVQVESDGGRGTTVVMTLPKFRAGVRAA
jgi:two-component system, LytTR family, sensor kinase